ncbi:endonuclease/exonuclease/phosphatase family protein [Methanothrix sp.]|uniref:endonuclease/exonuclease/phosphatase family protein n=1 Tax=Methanothrix sp. TaxID=90426 RepID=UPI003C74C181
MTIKVSIATFNLMSLDDRPDRSPSLDERIPILRPQLIRLNADILCLQEVCAQHERNGKDRLRALDRLLEGTPYESFNRASTVDRDGNYLGHHNLVTLSRYDIMEQHQYQHEYAPSPSYKKVTALPVEMEAREISWERPILHAKVRLPNGAVLDVINLHLKSRRPTNIQGHKLSERTWKTAFGWAEGVFISSMKRIGQALETRILIDNLFDDNRCALIAVCGDFNEELDEVSIEAIRGDVENTGNIDLAMRVMVPTERNIPEPARYSLLHNGKGKMLDHILVSRTMLAFFKGSEVHNELLHDESIVFAPRIFFPESDHAPVIARFELPESDIKWSTTTSILKRERGREKSHRSRYK